MLFALTQAKRKEKNKQKKVRYAKNKKARQEAERAAAGKAAASSGLGGQETKSGGPGVFTSGKPAMAVPAEQVRFLHISFSYLLVCS